MERQVEDFATQQKGLLEMNESWQVICNPGRKGGSFGFCVETDEWELLCMLSECGVHPIDIDREKRVMEIDLFFIIKKGFELIRSKMVNHYGESKVL